MVLSMPLAESINRARFARARVRVERRARWRRRRRRFYVPFDARADVVRERVGARVKVWFRLGVVKGKKEIFIRRATPKS